MRVVCYWGVLLFVFIVGVIYRLCLGSYLLVGWLICSVGSGLRLWGCWLWWVVLYLVLCG